MDKKGNATYLRLPLGLEDQIERQAKREGRSKNEMIVHLVARGVHFSRFNIEDYCTFFFENEGQICREK